MEQNSTQPNMTAPRKFSVPLKFCEDTGLSHDEWEVAGWSTTASATTPDYTPDNPTYTYEFPENPTNYTHEQTLYAFWEETGYGWIYVDDTKKWVKAQPWIFEQKADGTYDWIKVKKIWIHNGTEWKY